MFHNGGLVAVSYKDLIICSKNIRLVHLFSEDLVGIMQRKLNRHIKRLLPCTLFYAVHCFTRFYATGVGRTSFVSLRDVNHG